MSSIRLVLGLVAIVSATGAPAAEQLVRFYSDVSPQAREAFSQRNGGTLTVVSKAGNLYKWTASHNRALTWDANIQYVQKNRTYSLFQNPSIVANRDRLLAEL